MRYKQTQQCLKSWNEPESLPWYDKSEDKFSKLLWLAMPKLEGFYVIYSLFIYFERCS